MNKDIQAVNVTGRDEIPNKPGEFSYVQNFRENQICGMNFSCPCGCREIGLLLFGSHGINGGATWDWDGNEDMPTLKPSILRRGDCKWHGFLTDGIFKEC